MGKKKNMHVDEEDTAQDIEFSLFTDSSSKERLEIKFRVKKDFERLYKAIVRTYDKFTDIDYDTVIDLSGLFRCIDVKSKAISKGALYNLLRSQPSKRTIKKMKKAAKKCLEDLICGKDEFSWEFVGSVPAFELFLRYKEIIETNDALYCRIEIDSNMLNTPYAIKRAGEVIGSFAEEVVEAVKIGAGNKVYSYEPLDFEVASDCLTVHGILEDDVHIRLIDRTKFYMVKANIMIPDIMITVIRQVDEVDRVMESVMPSTDRYRLRLMYEKLTYNYDLTCAFLRDFAYNARLWSHREYEKEQLFEGFSDKVKETIVSKVDMFTRCENLTVNTAIELETRLVQAEEDKFSDDYSHWIFSGTFANVDKDFLVTAFEAIKKNVQSYGVPEQYVSIMITEVQ